jgi:hypothetical protein
MRRAAAPGSPAPGFSARHRRRCSLFRVVCHLPSAVCPLSSVVCRLPSVVCRLLSVVGRLSSVVCHLSSVICRLSSVVCRLSSVLCRLSSVVCRLLPVICCLLSVVCCPRGNRHAIAMPATRAITRPTRRPAYDAPTGSGRDGNASNPDRNEGADGFGQPRLHYVPSCRCSAVNNQQPTTPRAATPDERRPRFAVALRSSPCARCLLSVVRRVLGSKLQVLATRTSRPSSRTVAR